MFGILPAVPYNDKKTLEPIYERFNESLYSNDEPNNRLQEKMKSLSWTTNQRIRLMEDLSWKKQIGRSTQKHLRSIWEAATGRLSK